MESPSLSVGMVGLGAMGLPIAQRLLAAPFKVSAVARRPDAAREAAALGIEVVDSISELAARSDVLIICVYSDEQVDEVTFGAGGIAEGLGPETILINHTTGRPSTAQRLDALAAERGASFLDCALSGGPHDIARGELTLLVGGDVEVLDRARRVLESYASPILHVGAAGDGQKVKLLNNAVFGAQVALAVQAEKAAVGLGMDPGPVLAALTQGSARSFALEAASGHGSASGLVASAGRFIAKDVAVCEEVADELGADLGSLLALAREATPPG